MKRRDTSSSSISTSSSTSTQSAPVVYGPNCKSRRVLNWVKNFFKKGPQGSLILKSKDKIETLIARALYNSDQLQLFDDQPHASECVFAYPNSDWFGVYLVDSKGERYWDDENNAVKFYFKLRISPDGTDAAIIESTFNLPGELTDSNGNEIEQCVARGSFCGDPESMRPVKGTGRSAAASPSSSRSSVQSQVQQPLLGLQVSPAILSQLEKLSLGGGQGTSGGQSSSSSRQQPGQPISREIFDRMGSKEQIIDYMINNMPVQDLKKCLPRESFTADELREAEEIASRGGGTASSSDVGGEVGELSQTDMDAIEAAESMSEGELSTALKKITKEAISNLINKSEGNDNDRITNIFRLCKRAGIDKYTTDTRRGKLRLFEGQDQLDPEEIDKVLTECVKLEYDRVNNGFGRITRRKVSKTKIGRRKVSKTKKRTVSKTKKRTVLKTKKNNKRKY